ETLYGAGLREYQRRHWGNAVAAFEKLTTDLPARDTLLPRAYWYLANAHGRCAARGGAVVPPAVAPAQSRRHVRRNRARRVQHFARAVRRNVGPRRGREARDPRSRAVVRDQ